MKAITFDRHGGSNVLRYTEVPAPRASRGEVVIAVRAVSVNHGPDVETRRKGFGMRAISFPHITGSDPAGEIVEIGDGVDGFSIGDRVAVYPVIACGECDFCRAGRGENYCRKSHFFGVETAGGRAEYVAAPATQLIRLPENVSFEAAAALGVAYTTTWHGLVARGAITPEDTVLVVGAGGACGVAGIQIAQHVGARVIALTGDDRKRDRLLSLGADLVLSYKDPTWPEAVKSYTGGLGVTLAFDNGGTDTLPSSVECLARGGRLVCSGGTSGLEATLNIRTLYRNHISLLFYVQGSKHDMETLVDLVASGGFDPVIDQRYPLQDAALADDCLEASRQIGRVVLVVDPPPAPEPGGSQSIPAAIA
jgi:acryloyl-coenzyme A reductase